MEVVQNEVLPLPQEGMAESVAEFLYQQYNGRLLTYALVVLCLLPGAVCHRVWPQA
jgi:hypothetical protein